MITASPPRTVVGAISRHLIADHDRLAALLDAAEARPDAIEMKAFGEFRRGLLRHIGLEEKILFPAAQRAGGGTPLVAAIRLRRDHGALAALLVPTPTRAIIAAIRTILADHNRLEEGPGGVYDVCERMLASECDGVLATLHAAPPVPVNSHVDGELVVAALHRALIRAGYDPNAMGL